MNMWMERKKRLNRKKIYRKGHIRWNMGKESLDRRDGRGKRNRRDRNGRKYGRGR